MDIVEALTSYTTYQRKSTDHARTGFNGVSGMGEVFSFALIRFLLGQVVDDKCGFHEKGEIDE